MTKDMLCELFSTLDAKGYFPYLQSDTLNIIAIDTCGLLGTDGKLLTLRNEVLSISDSLILRKIEHPKRGDVVYNNYISLGVNRCDHDTIFLTIWHYSHLLQKLPVGIDHEWYTEDFHLKIGRCDLQLLSSSVW